MRRFKIQRWQQPLHIERAVDQRVKLLKHVVKIAESHTSTSMKSILVSIEIIPSKKLENCVNIRNDLTLETKISKLRFVIKTSQLYLQNRMKRLPL